MLKWVLIALIVVGALGVTSHFFPQFIGAELITIGGFTLTGWVVIVAISAFAGHKMIH